MKTTHRANEFPAGTKLAEQANLGMCTIRSMTMFGSDLIKRFYNKRYEKTPFKFKVM